MDLFIIFIRNLSDDIKIVNLFFHRMRLKSEIQASNPKFEQIVQVARDLFWRFGIQRVTIEEICRTASVSKMTFYKYFVNKNDLLIFIIHRMFDESLNKYNNIMNLPVEYPEKVRQMIHIKLQMIGEMSFNFFRDYLHAADPEIKKLIEQKTAEMLGIVIRDFRAAQDQGYLRADLKPEFILFFINNMSDWMSDEKLFTQYGSAKELTAELINFFFYGVMARNKRQED